MALTPAQRSQRARIGGYALAASHDPRDYTEAARSKFRSRFVEQVDPDLLLPEHERARRAEAARKQYYTTLALKRAVARSNKKAPGFSHPGASISEVRHGGGETSE